jgi:hypothetical protein
MKNLFLERKALPKELDFLRNFFDKTFFKSFETMFWIKPFLNV